MKITSRYLRLPRPVRGVGFHAPRYSPHAHRLIRGIAGVYMKTAEKMGSIDVRGLDAFADSFEKFHRGECRLIILFRHPSRKDPPVLGYTLNNLLPRLCREAGRPLGFVPHARFLYGKDVLNWAGLPAVLAFPRLGHIPVQNLGPNREGMNLLRKELQEGIFPVALAPEGQVTYHARLCQPLASGFASLAQWGLESGKDVLILPVALGYEYASDPERLARSLLERWQFETDLKLELPVSSGDITELMLEATDKTLAIVETFCAKHNAHREPDDGDEVGLLTGRIEKLCRRLLSIAEDIAGISHSGTIIDREFRIRYEGMGRIYREDGDPKKFPPLARRLADLHSLEARVFLHYHQIVDVLEYLDPSYLYPEGNDQRSCEYILNLLDVINRMKGGDINSRYYPPGHKAVIQASAPVSLLEWTGGKRLDRELKREFTAHIRDVLNTASREIRLNGEESPVS